jgi:hypothetical protein
MMAPHPLRGGCLFPHRFVAWQRRGLSARAAGALASAGCDTTEKVARPGRSYFEGRPNYAAKTQALQMAFRDPEEAREATADVMASLRRDGFVLTTIRRADASSVDPRRVTRSVREHQPRRAQTKEAKSDVQASCIWHSPPVLNIRNVR